MQEIPKGAEKKQDTEENGIPKNEGFIIYLIYIYIYIELGQTTMKMHRAPINKDIDSRVQTHWGKSWV